MEIFETATVKLIENDLKQIVAFYLNDKGFNVEPSNVKFDIQPTVEGCGTDSRMAYRIGCRVEIEGSRKTWQKD